MHFIAFAHFPMDSIYGVVEHKGEQILICGRLVGKMRSAKHSVQSTLFWPRKIHPTALERELLTFIKGYDSREIGFSISGDRLQACVRLS